MGPRAQQNAERGEKPVARGLRQRMRCAVTCMKRLREGEGERESNQPRGELMVSQKHRKWGCPRGGEKTNASLGSASQKVEKIEPKM